jgi:hypothetical protein
MLRSTPRHCVGECEGRRRTIGASFSRLRSPIFGARLACEADFSAGVMIGPQASSGRLYSLSSSSSNPGARSDGVLECWSIAFCLNRSAIAGRRNCQGGLWPALTVWQDDLTKTTNCVAHAAPQRLGDAATCFGRATSKDKTCQRPFNALEPRPTRLAP